MIYQALVSGTNLSLHIHTRIYVYTFASSGSKYLLNLRPSGTNMFVPFSLPSFLQHCGECWAYFSVKLSCHSCPHVLFVVVLLGLWALPCTRLAVKQLGFCCLLAAVCPPARPPARGSSVLALAWSPASCPAVRRVLWSSAWPSACPLVLLPAWLPACLLPSRPPACSPPRSPAWPPACLPPPLPLLALAFPSRLALNQACNVLRCDFFSSDNYLCCYCSIVHRLLSLQVP